MNLAAFLEALTTLTTWVKNGLATKQSKVTVSTTDPASGDGVNGDIVVVVDP